MLDIGVEDINVVTVTLVDTSVATGSGQSTYLGQMGHG